MSSSSEIVDSSLFSGQNMPEKPTFSRTCNLFSQYLKGNSTTFPDLTLGRRPAPLVATMNLFPVVNSVSATATAQMQQDQSRTMTMFYGGQVIAFHDIAPEKAIEIMKLAEQGTARKPPRPDQVSNNFVVSGSDLPIARKASIARFLEKRKDRIMARSPYQAAHDASKQDDCSNKAWLGLGGAQSHY